ncbi:TonB-dependent receptor [Helicobacter muridarum]|uniref:TonB-dependent receptor n=1 Tax=Helicobacter muridarum TaxID=216 RepID=A0A377PSH2_9HELI|nr:TonB-dependent receptor [Helicobacter muridarum]STQ85429.1 TonB-dependent receptor [Helicobacter muridarum]
MITILLVLRFKHLVILIAIYYIFTFIVKGKNLKKEYISFIASLLLLTNLGYSKEENEAIRLEAATITATRIPTTIDEAPGNLSVISQEEIHIRPNSKISDTLRGIEGLRQSKSRGLDTFDTVTIRGIPNGATIMLDGVILNDMNNNTKMITSMNPSDLLQVEVIRGPFSNLYGSGAISGAINFVTAMPEKFEVKTNIAYGSPFMLNTAPENLVRGYISIGNVFFDSKLKLKASYGFSTSDGYAADTAFVESGDTILSGNTGAIDSVNPQGKPIKIVGNMGKQAYQIHDFKLRANLDITENISLDSGFYFNFYGYRHDDPKTFLRDSNGREVWGNNTNTNSSGTLGTHGTNRPLPIGFGRNIGKERYAQSIFYIGYTQYFDEIMLQAKYSRIDGWRDFNNPDGGAKASSLNGSSITNAPNTTMLGGQGSNTKDRYQTNNLDIFSMIPIFDSKHKVLAGGQIRHQQFDNEVNNIFDWTKFDSAIENFKSSQNAKSINSGIFVELRSQWLNNLSTTLGLRYDYWLGYDFLTSGRQASENSKHKISPKVTINYLPFSLTTIKASFGQGFRAPTLTNLFSNHVRTDGVVTLGNPNLKPESVTAFDIGVEQKLNIGQYQGLMKAYYFNTYRSDIIFTNIVNSTGRIENGGLALINGLEFSYKQSLPFYFSLLLTYTYTNSEHLTNPGNPNLVGKKLTGIPEHLGFIQIAYDNSKFFGSFGLEMMSKPFANADNSDTISGVYGSTDGFVLGDLLLGYRFLKNYEASLNITNIFNYKYFSFYRAPGAAFYIQLAAKF